MKSGGGDKKSKVRMEVNERTVFLRVVWGKRVRVWFRAPRLSPSLAC